jgi:alkanesulfonate monooxygenase SsuD/methylene tetrahydromethanopterin reductase-like flavin-dependent oxidoreductase (luciferase family)
VAGNGPGTLDRIVEYGDGWIPIPGRGSVTLGEGTARLQELAAERGRPPVPVTVFGTRPEAEIIDHYAAAGVDRVLFRLPSVESAEALKLLDTYANLAETERS